MNAVALVAWVLNAAGAAWAAPPQLVNDRGLSVQGYGDRVALVIGNQRYESSQLAHTERDAADMARVLAGLGFDVIIDRDLDRDGMLRLIADFGARLKRAKRGVGLVYYAGHAVEVEGQNYLLPIGSIARLPDDRYVDVEAVSLARILKELDESGASIKLVILDACRNNPLPSRQRTTLAGMAPIEATSGTLVAYATQPHRTALDDSLYTRALLKHLPTPGLRLDELFGRVRADVAGATNEGQVPLETWGLRGEPFYFVAPPEPEVVCPPGTVLKDARCIGQVVCPSGTVLAANGIACAPTLLTTCPPGTRLIEGTGCVPITTPPGASPPTSGDLVVESEPPGAAVYVGLTPVGVTPLRQSLAEGEYVVTVRRPDWRFWSKTIQVAKGREVRVTVDPVPSGAPATGLQSELDGAPDWALRGCDDRGGRSPAICGVGSWSGINPALAHVVANGRAALEVARTLQIKVKAMIKDYQASSTEESYGQAAGDAFPGVVASKQVTDTTLLGLAENDSWQSLTGTTWKLATLDVEALDRHVREALLDRAERALSTTDGDVAAMGNRSVIPSKGAARQSDAAEPGSVRGVGCGDVVVWQSTVEREAQARLTALVSGLYALAAAMAGVHVKALLKDYQSSGTGGAGIGAAPDDEQVITDVARLTTHLVLPGLTVDGELKDYQSTTMGGAGSGTAADDEQSSAWTVTVRTSSPPDVIGVQMREATRAAGGDGLSPIGFTTTLSERPSVVLPRLLAGLEASGVHVLRFNEPRYDKGAPVVTVDLRWTAPSTK